MLKQCEIDKRANTCGERGRLGASYFKSTNLGSDILILTIDRNMSSQLNASLGKHFWFWHIWNTCRDVMLSTLTTASSLMHSVCGALFKDSSLALHTYQPKWWEIIKKYNILSYSWVKIFKPPCVNCVSSQWDEQSNVRSKRNSVTIIIHMFNYKL